MKAGIVVDDWKLPVFRKRLSEAGFAYNDGGPMTGDTTLLTIVTDDLVKLQTIVQLCQMQCKAQRRN